MSLHIRVILRSYATKNLRPWGRFFASLRMTFLVLVRRFGAYIIHCASGCFSRASAGRGNRPALQQTRGWPIRRPPLDALRPRLGMEKREVKGYKSIGRR